MKNNTVMNNELKNMFNQMFSGIEMISPKLTGVLKVLKIELINQVELLRSFSRPNSQDFAILSDMINNSKISKSYIFEIIDRLFPLPISDSGYPEVSQPEIPECPLCKSLELKDNLYKVLSVDFEKEKANIFKSHEKAELKIESSVSILQSKIVELELEYKKIDNHYNNLLDNSLVHYSNNISVLNNISPEDLLYSSEVTLFDRVLKKI